MQRRGLLIILSSPSGAGKSSLANRLRQWDPSLQFSVSATTRPMRKGELDGQDYYFISEPEFNSQIDKGEMLEYAHVFDHIYGSPKGPVQQAIKQGRDVLFDIDWQGAQQISNSDLQKNVLSIFILPPSIMELHDRLQKRGQDNADVIERRMAKSMDEISHWDGYDYVVINDDLEQTVANLITIISAERQRRSQQPSLVDHIRDLQTEFDGMA